MGRKIIKIKESELAEIISKVIVEDMGESDGMSGGVSREKMMDVLKSKFNIRFVRPSEDFDGNEGGIWMSGEDGETLPNGHRIFDYYNESSKYELGVYKKFAEYLEKHGWYAEWYDAGTVFLWPE